MSPEVLRQIASNFSTLVESPFVNQSGVVIGWHSTCVDSANRPLGSGFSDKLDQARRISIAETIERTVFRDLMHTFPPGLGLESNPNTDGFACGFEDKPTMIRAICEAVERWIWSKWIDDGFSIEMIKSPVIVSPLQQSVMDQFDEIHFYQQKVSMILSGKIFVFHFGATIAHKGGGVFPGSRVSLDEGSLWQHSLIESLRNYNIFYNESGRADIICSRIKRFGSDGSSGINQIKAAHKSNWPSPRLKILKPLSLKHEGFYMWRALCDSYIDWHTGSVERFVY